MRRPRVVTVLTGRSWEEDVVALGRQTGTIRIVGRVYRPEEVGPLAPDVVVVGDETAWLSRDVVGLWTALGITTVVAGDRRPEAHASIQWAPAEPRAIIDTIRLVWISPKAAPTPFVVSIVGPPGSGVTEIACAMATSLAPCRLVDRQPPAADLRLAGRREARPVEVADSFPIQASKDPIVVDCGARSDSAAGSCFFVVADSPAGFVRANHLVEAWSGPVPTVILNMVHDPERARASVRRAVGLEPGLLIPYDQTIHRAAAESDPAPDWLIAKVRSLLTGADGRGPR